MEAANLFRILWTQYKIDVITVDEIATPFLKVSDKDFPYFSTPKLVTNVANIKVRSVIAITPDHHHNKNSWIKHQLISDIQNVSLYVSNFWFHASLYLFEVVGLQSVVIVYSKGLACNHCSFVLQALLFYVHRCLITGLIVQMSLHVSNLFYIWL